MPRFVDEEIQEQQLQIVGAEFPAARKVIVTAEPASVARESATAIVPVTFAAASAVTMASAMQMVVVVAVAVAVAVAVVVVVVVAVAVAVAVAVVVVVAVAVARSCEPEASKQVAIGRPRLRNPG
jgi:hypothetical protein